MARKGDEAGYEPSSAAAGGVIDLTAPTTGSPPPTVNLEWGKSAYDKEFVEKWTASEAFRPGEIVRWRAPNKGDTPTLDSMGGRFVILSSAHIICGLRLDASDFLLSVLSHYGIEWSHLPPNSMTVLSIFAHLCEAYLGVAPTVEVFTHFYRLYPNAKGESMTLGGTYFRLRDRMKNHYPEYSLKTTHYMWSCAWFYAELAPSCRLTFTGFPLKEMSSWDITLPLSSGQSAQILQIKKLRNEGLTGLDIVRDYVKHRISPLRRRTHLASEYTGPGDPTRDSDRELSQEAIESTLNQLLNLKKMEENAPSDRSNVPTSLVGMSAVSPNERTERSRGLLHVPLSPEAKEKAMEEMAVSKKNNKSSTRTYKPLAVVIGRCTRQSAALVKTNVSPPPKGDSSMVQGHSGLEDMEILEATPPPPPLPTTTATTTTATSTECPVEIEEEERAELVEPTASFISVKRKIYPCPSGYYQRKAKISSLDARSRRPGSAQPSSGSSGEAGENGSLVILAKVAGHALLDQPAQDSPPEHVDPLEQPITNGVHGQEGTHEGNIEAMCEQIKRGEAAASELREHAMKLVKENKILKSRNLMLEQQLTDATVTGIINNTLHATVAFWRTTCRCCRNPTSCGREGMIMKLNEQKESHEKDLVNLRREIIELKRQNEELQSNISRAKDIFKEIFKGP